MLIIPFQHSCAYYNCDSSVRAREEAAVAKDREEIQELRHKITRATELSKLFPVITDHFHARSHQLLTMAIQTADPSSLLSTAQQNLERVRTDEATLSPFTTSEDMPIGAQLQRQLRSEEKLWQSLAELYTPGMTVAARRKMRETSAANDSEMRIEGARTQEVVRLQMADLLDQQAFLKGESQRMTMEGKEMQAYDRLAFNEGYWPIAILVILGYVVWRPEIKKILNRTTSSEQDQVS